MSLYVHPQLGIEGSARQKPRILPAATGAGLIAYSALNAGALGGPLAAGVVGAGVGCAYLGIPKTQLVDEGPLVLGGEFWVRCQLRALRVLRWEGSATAATVVMAEWSCCCGCACSAAVSGGLMGMAFSKAVAAGAATREGKVMTLAGLASLGAFGCVPPPHAAAHASLRSISTERACCRSAAQSVGSGYGWPHCIQEVRRGPSAESWVTNNVDQRVARDVHVVAPAHAPLPRIHTCAPPES